MMKNNLEVLFITVISSGAGFAGCPFSSMVKRGGNDQKSPCRISNDKRHREQLAWPRRPFIETGVRESIPVGVEIHCASR
jgi:hypothetical protein